MKKIILSCILLLSSILMVANAAGAPAQIVSENKTTTLTKDSNLVLHLTFHTAENVTPEVVTQPKVAEVSDEVYTKAFASIEKNISKKRIFVKKFDRHNGPALDLKGTDIVNYRKTELKNAGIRYVQPVLSVRLRAQASKMSSTLEYLLRNEAVQLTNTGNLAHGWTQAKTLNRWKTGFIWTKYLREPNVTDLVRIKKADQAYWSDIGHAQVASKVNVRVEPWYGSRILAVFDKQTSLYILDEINGWMEVLTDSGVHGYIKSNYVVTTKIQKEDWLKGVR